VVGDARRSANACLWPRPEQRFRSRLSPEDLRRLLSALSVEEALESAIRSSVVDSERPDRMQPPRRPWARCLRVGRGTTEQVPLAHFALLSRKPSSSFCKCSDAATGRRPPRVAQRVRANVRKALRRDLESHLSTKYLH